MNDHGFRIKLPDRMYCAEQIEIPMDLAPVLKQFAKDALRANPKNLVKWAANYFAQKAGQKEPFVLDDKEEQSATVHEEAEVASYDALESAGNNYRRPIVLSGPSVFREDLIERLLGDIGYRVVRAVRQTTQPDARLLTHRVIAKNEMRSRIAQGTFLEYKTVDGITSGTCSKDVVVEMQSMKTVLLYVDLEGVLMMKERESLLPKKPLYVFVMPSDMDRLEKEIREQLSRKFSEDGDELEAQVQQRLAQARDDIKFYNSDEGRALFDTALMDDDFNSCYAELKTFFENNSG